MTYDPEFCARLARGAREDDATIRWADRHFAEVPAWPECGHDELTCPCFTENDKARSVLAKATLRTRNNLRAMADQLDASVRYFDDTRDQRERDAVEIMRLRGVIDERTTQRDAARAEVARLADELDHAVAAEGDHLSKASRRMVDTVMNERDALRAQNDELRRTVDTLQAQVEAVAPVVDAAEAWVDAPIGQGRRAIGVLGDAIDAYRAKEPT